jgi:hypothetical protein
MKEEAAVGGDATDGGQMVAGERHLQQWRLPLWRPGAHRHGEQVEARLVYPDDGPSFLDRFFSRAGQRSRHHTWIAAALR